MLAVLVVATWSKQSNYSSSAHAEIVAQAAWSELKASGEARGAVWLGGAVLCWNKTIWATLSESLWIVVGENVWKPYT